MMKPGTYEVTYGTPQGFTVESLMSGSVDLMKSPFVVSADLVPEFAAVLNVSDPTLFVKVSGKITGNRRSGLQVRLNGGAGAPFGGGMQSPVAADGSFEFPKVLPGSYTAVFDTEQVTLTVGSRDVTDVQIVMPEVMEVPARVQVEGGGPIPRLTFAIAGASNR
jgi:hypothetical protein